MNDAPPAGELERLRTCTRRGRPFGEEGWVRRTAAALGLEHTLREAGRPPKAGARGGNQ